MWTHGAEGPLTDGRNISVRRFANGGGEPCDGCLTVPPVLSLVGARVSGGYDIGLRLCSACRAALYELLSIAEREESDGTRD